MRNQEKEQLPTLEALQAERERLRHRRRYRPGFAGHSVGAGGGGGAGRADLHVFHAGVPDYRFQYGAEPERRPTSSWP